MTEDEVVGWHHRLNGHEFEWIPGVGDGQWGLACCDSWCHKELDTIERLNWTDGRYRCQLFIFSNYQVFSTLKIFLRFPLEDLGGCFSYFIKCSARFHYGKEEQSYIDSSDSFERNTCFIFIAQQGRRASFMMHSQQHEQCLPHIRNQKPSSWTHSTEFFFFFNWVFKSHIFLKATCGK